MHKPVVVPDFRDEPQRAFHVLDGIRLGFLFLFPMSQGLHAAARVMGRLAWRFAAD